MYSTKASSYAFPDGDRASGKMDTWEHKVRDILRSWENWQSGERNTGICNCYSWPVSMLPKCSLLCVFSPLQLIAFVLKKEMIQHDATV